MTSHDNLRKLAMGATPGPWRQRSSVLSESDAEVAFVLYRDGLRPKEIATRLGVTPNLISQTVRRRRLLEGH